MELEFIICITFVYINAQIACAYVIYFYTYTFNRKTSLFIIIQQELTDIYSQNKYLSAKKKTFNFCKEIKFILLSLQAMGLSGPLIT